MFRLISGQGDYLNKLTTPGRDTMLMDVWMEWAKKYGPLFHYRLYHKHVVPIVYGPDAIKVTVLFNFFVKVSVKIQLHTNELMP